MSDSSCPESRKFADLLDADDQDGLQSALDAYRILHSPEQMSACVLKVAKEEQKGQGIDIEPLFKNGKLTAVELSKGILSEKVDM